MGSYNNIINKVLSHWFKAFYVSIHISLTLIMTALAEGLGVQVCNILSCPLSVTHTSFLFGVEEKPGGELGVQAVQQFVL